MGKIPKQHVTRLIAMERRAQTIAEAGGLEAALAGGTLPNPIDTTLAEGLVLGLLKQGVRKYLAVFGHGSTDLAEVLRVYEAAGLTRTYNFRHETAMAHAATALKWHCGRAAGHSPAGHRRQHLPHCSRDRADGGAMSRLHSLRHAGAPQFRPAAPRARARTSSPQWRSTRSRASALTGVRPRTIMRWSAATAAVSAACRCWVATTSARRRCRCRRRLRSTAGRRWPKV